jgi:hypothetical protein
MNLSKIMIPIADNSSYRVNVQMLITDFYNNPKALPINPKPEGLFDKNYVGIDDKEPAMWRHIVTDEKEIQIVSNHKSVHSKFVWEPQFSCDYLGTKVIYSLFIRNLKDEFGITFVIIECESLAKRAVNILTGLKLFVPYVINRAKPEKERIYEGV